jgi:hypothetical protein
MSTGEGNWLQRLFGGSYNTALSRAFQLPPQQYSYVRQRTARAQQFVSFVPVQSSPKAVSLETGNWQLIAKVPFPSPAIYNRAFQNKALRQEPFS